MQQQQQQMQQMQSSNAAAANVAAMILIAHNAVHRGREGEGQGGREDQQQQGLGTWL